MVRRKRVLNAYYSTEASKLFGYALYRLLNGSPIAVTEVMPENRDSTSQWPDTKFVGKVIEFIDNYPTLEVVMLDALMDSAMSEDCRENEEDEWEEWDDDYDWVSDQEAS